MTAWKLALAAGCVLLLVLLVIAHRRHRNPLDLTDVLRDRSTGKASLTPLLILGSFGLAAVGVIALLARGQDATSLISIVLGIFVAKQGLTQTVDTIKGPPPTPDTTASTTVKTTETETRTLT